MVGIKKWLAAALVHSILVGAATAQTGQGYVPVFASTSTRWLSQATLIKPLARNTVISFTVHLNLRNKAQLDQLVQALYDPHSPRYHKFLTREAFIKDYAPSAEAAQKMLKYFLAQGVRAKIINHRIRVTATVQQIAQLFKVQMNYYRYQNRNVYANNRAPQVRADLAPYVAEISGLNNIEYFHKGTHQLKQFHKKREKNNIMQPRPLYFTWGNFVPQAQPSTQSLNNFTGAQLRIAYDLDAITPVQGQVIDGLGQTLVIIDECGTKSTKQILADANLYNALNGFSLQNSTNFTVVNPDGTPVNCQTHDPDWDLEISLDVQASHTIAQGANTVLVLTHTGGLTQATMDVIDTLVNQEYQIGGFTNAYVLSNSWSGTESIVYSPALEASMEIAAAHGISINFATGDCGDGTYNAPGCPAQGVQPTVQYPPSSAFVTAVGGTSLFVDNNWHYAFESLWGTYTGGQFTEGSSGGISQMVDAVPWQSSISGFTAGGYPGTVGSNNKRAIPDIAMVADPHTGLIIYSGGQPIVFAGTSLSSPLFSATLTLINQRRYLLHRLTPIGLAAPYLYVLNSDLLRASALRLVAPPHLHISGALPPPLGAPTSAFTLEDFGEPVTFGWDSSLTIAPESQFWNDGVGVGSPNIPKFVAAMSML